MAVIENRFVCDLSKPVQAQALKGNVFSLDNFGSRISVLIYNNGQPATISGSITANCILPDGSTVNVNGTLTTENSGSKAYIDVPQGCLLIPGILKIAIKCTSSSVITTLAAIVANVYMTKTDNVITPSQQIIADWNAEVSAAIATQNAAIANQDTKINDLKSTMNAVPDSINKITGNLFGVWTYGYYKTPADGADTSYGATTDYVTTLIPVAPGEQITVNATGYSGTSRLYVFITEDWKAIGRCESNLSGERTLTAPANAKYLGVNNKLSEQASGYYAYKGTPLNNLAFKYIKNLTEADDLNNYNGYEYTGWYYWTSSHVPNVNGHAPVSDKAAKLLVFSTATNATVQLAFVSNQTSDTMYRVNYSSGWSDWKTLAREEEIIALKNALESKIASTENSIDSSIESITGNKIYHFTEGYWIETSGTVTPLNPVEKSGAACIAVSCQEGDVFTLTGKGYTSTHMLYVFIDNQGEIKGYSGSNATADKENITAPADTAYLVVNVNTSYEYQLFGGKLVQQQIHNTLNIDDINQYKNENGLLTEGTYELSIYPDIGNIMPLLVNIQAKYDSGLTTSVPYVRMDCYARTGSRIFFSYTYLFASDTEYVKQAWRIPNCFEVGQIKFVIIVPTGTTLDVKYFDSHYDNTVRKGTGNIIFHAHRGLDGLFPPGSYNAYVAASELGFQSCIEIPKFTSDGVAVCFHNDGGEGSTLSSVFTMPDGSAVSVLADASKTISDFTYAELMEWSIGYSKNSIFADAKISTMDDFLRICAETGMRPIFSIHPAPTLAQWSQLKVLLDKYKLTKWLSVKSGDTGVWKNVIDTFGDGNIYSIINIVGSSSTYDILSKITNGRTYSGAATTRIDVEFLDVGLKSATYGEAQHQMLEDAIEAGYVASVALSNETTGKEIKDYMNTGVTEFTCQRHTSIGLNW